MSKMPIKKSFCDSWYQACYNDLFCGAGGGDFFSCAKVSEIKFKSHKLKFDKLYIIKNFQVYKAENPTQTALNQSNAMNADLIALTVILTVFGCCLILFAGYLVHREKQGKSVFTPLLGEETSDGLPVNLNTRSRLSRV